MVEQILLEEALRHIGELQITEESTNWEVPKITAQVHQAIKLMLEYCNLGKDISTYPQVQVSNAAASSCRTDPKGKSEIHICENDISCFGRADASTIGHESFHWLRKSYTAKARSDDAETFEATVVDEFFGRLGEKVYRAALQSRSRLKRLCFLRSLVSIPRIICDTALAIEAEPLLHRVVQSPESRQQLTSDEERILTHYLGYSHADRVGIHQIQNWKQFLSAPDSEIRRKCSF